ncbi:MAG TPA: SDR family NAD(P)-dependent oxidoreductase [Nevskiaceae bacterium]|nr:SDR family NAD(P)-dependent oxidoreductase [Nevskiaceae bacterium]
MPPADPAAALTLLATLPAGAEALVVGASRGIGLALAQRLAGAPGLSRLWLASRHPAEVAALQALAADHPQQVRLLGLDLEDDASLEAVGATLAAAGARLHLVLSTVGVLQQLPGLRPERRLADLQRAALSHSLAVNAIGPALLLRALADRLCHGERALFASLSARVGSIGDNRLGGWYSYRAAKAAQNQLIHTAAIELARRSKALVCVTLHPGTVDTELSRPFQSGVAAERLFSPLQSADYLLAVLAGLTPAESGGFYAWDGQPIPW